MKTKFLKCGMLMIATVACTTLTKAQDSTRVYNSYANQYHDKNGNVKEQVQTNYNNHEYNFDVVNDKITNLEVDGTKIPAGEYGKYSTAISGIRTQIKKDRIQAAKDRIQAGKDRAQADVDRKQAEKDREQGETDRAQGEKDRAQTEKDREQGKKDRAEALHGQEQAKADREQAAKDREEAVKDRAQAEVDRQQAVKDRTQATIDRKQAAEDRALMQEMLADIVKDGIAPDESSIHTITMGPDGMTVNDKKQPDAIYKRYITKYTRFAKGNFSYGNNHSGYTGIHISRSQE